MATPTKTHNEDIPENELRVSKHPGLGKYLRRAHGLLVSDEQKYEEIILRGAGAAIPNIVPLAELIRRKVLGLHQNTEITTLKVMEFSKRSGEEEERTIVMLKVTLSMNPDADFKDSAGYQEPIAESEIEEFTEEAPIREDAYPRGEGETRGRGRRGGARGGRGGRGGRGRGGRT